MSLPHLRSSRLCRAALPILFLLGGAQAVTFNLSFTGGKDPTTGGACGLTLGSRCRYNNVVLNAGSGPFQRDAVVTVTKLVGANLSTSFDNESPTFSGTTPLTGTGADFFAPTVNITGLNASDYAEFTFDLVTPGGAVPAAGTGTANLPGNFYITTFDTDGSGGNLKEFAEFINPAQTALSTTPATTLTSVASTTGNAADKRFLSAIAAQPNISQDDPYKASAKFANSGSFTVRYGADTGTDVNLARLTAFNFYLTNSVFKVGDVDGYKSVKLTNDADGNGVISGGDTVTYTVTYVNTGNADVNGFQIIDGLPGGLPIAGTPTVRVNGVTTPAAVNTTYNGTSSVALLAAGQTLSKNGTISVDIPVNVTAVTIDNTARNNQTGASGTYTDAAGATISLSNLASDNVDSTTAFPPSVIAATGFSVPPVGSVLQTQNPNTLDATTLVVRTKQAELALGQTAPVAVGSGASYSTTIQVWNNGPSILSNLTVQDVLPSGSVVTGLTCTASGTATCGTTSFTATTVTIKTGTMTIDTVPGNTVPDGNYLTYTLTLTAAANGSSNNRVSLNPPSGVTDNNLTNNDLTVRTRIIDAVNDALVTFQQGTGGTVNVIGNDTVGGPAATAASSVVNIVNNGGITNLSVDASRNLVVPATTLPGNYTVTYQLCDAVLTTACDTATVPITVNVVVVTPDLSLTKSGPAYARPSTVASSNPPVSASDNFISYVLSVNTKNASATGTTTVTDTLPASFSPAGFGFTASPGSWMCSASGQVITCTTTSTITVGTPETITLNNIKVPAGTAAAPSFTNTASVSNPAESAADAAIGNSASVTTQLILTEVKKELRNVTADTRDNGGAARFGTSVAARPGEVLEYCLTTNNLGGANLPSYVLTDPLNASGTALTSVTSDAAYANKAIKFTRTTPGNPSPTTTSGSYTAASGDDDGTLNTSLNVNMQTFLGGETMRTCFQVQIN